LSGFLGFEDEAAALIKVDESAAFGAVGVVKNDFAFEDVGVVFKTLRGGLGLGQVEKGTEFGEKKLIVLALGTAGFGPALDEGRGVFGGSGGRFGHEFRRGVPD
jgi:hypothetical protein